MYHSRRFRGAATSAVGRHVPAWMFPSELSECSKSCSCLIIHVGLHDTKEQLELDLLSCAHSEVRALLRNRLRLFVRQTSLIKSSDVATFKVTVSDHHCEKSTK